jgi:3-dehydroquinate synthase
MGTGKTTVGSILADRCGMDFIDLDAEIERRAGSTIAEFWAQHGEPAFRDLEAQTFADLMNGSSRGGGCIFATGGGTLVSERNRARVQPDDVVFCLTCDVEGIRSRLDGERDVRPLVARLDGEDVAAYMEDRLGRRRAAYELYQQVDTTRRLPEEVAGEIERLTDISSFDLRFDAARVSRIVFGRGVAGRLGDALVQQGVTGSVLVVTDDVVNELPLVRAATASIQAPGVDGREGGGPRLRGAALRFAGTNLLPAGEQHKTLVSVDRIYRAAMSAKLDRSSTIVGIGGGVIGDLAGHAAATYMRGIQLVLVPTTLVAQVDATIGGKVGVDFEGIKNLVGAFHPARVIAIDPDLLATLPDTALADGMAEIVKIAMVFSADLLSRVEALGGVRDILAAPAIIRLAAALKARIVERDPFERGDRALLNFGHTVGHGIESASVYRVSHGQAISAGMVAETWLAARLGLADRGAPDRLGALLGRFGLPGRVEGVDTGGIWSAMQSDKKRRDGKLRFGLSTVPGSGSVVEVAAADARDAVGFACRKDGRQ